MIGAAQAAVKGEPLDVRMPFDEHGVAELMRPITVFLCLHRHRFQCVILLKRTEEFVVARTGLVHAGHDPVDNQQSRFRSDTSRRHTAA